MTAAERQLAFDGFAADVAPLAGLVSAAWHDLQPFPVSGLSPAEQDLLASTLHARSSPNRPSRAVDGCDHNAMDDALVRARSLSERRDMGQFLTPWPIVETMVDWVRGQQPCQVVDVGSGTGRFAIAAGRALPNARIIAVDSDPVACLICRARVRTLGLANVEVHCADFLQDALPIGSGKTAYLGNPPYVRHHRVSPPLKAWAAAACRRLCIPFSALAGLHLYFFLAIALRGQPGDVGCLITSAEWLDVNYGRTLRRLLLERLGVRSVCVLDDSVAAFEDAMTSAAITCFEIGSASPSVCFSQVREFDRAEGPVSAYGARREALPERWRLLCRDGHQSVPCGPIARLGDLFSVHRGIATGANRFFVMSQPEASARGLQRFAHPVVTAGLEVLRAQGELDLGTLDRLILIPARIEDIGPDRDREAVKRWLSEGEKAGVPSRFLCRHRSPWWWLGNAVPPPLVASYMARRPPAFALNPGGALLLNIAHGLYPRHPMTAAQLRGAVSMLNDAAHTFVANGRCYQGGLVKFEPREMERLVIPGAVAPDDSPPPSPEESLVDAAQVAPGVHD